jgi:hypothetical protein
MKECSKCGDLLGLSFFRECKYPSGAPYHKSICESCERIATQQYAQHHKKERKAYTKNFVTNNPQYIKDWKSDNREKIRKQERERRVSDINFRLKKNVSRAISHIIKKNGSSTFKNLPYTTQELKRHLENQFDDKMSWENYGSYWHVDHIIPHSTFKYSSMKDDAFRECWALNNLRPLEAKENQSDGATRIRHKR